MATAPNYDNVRLGGPSGLRVPSEAGSAVLAVGKKVTVAQGALSADTSVNLNAEQSAASYIEATASGAHALTLILAAAMPGHLYAVYNHTANNLILKVGSGGTGITVATTKRALLVSGDTDIERLSADV